MIEGLPSEADRVRDAMRLAGHGSYQVLHARDFHAGRALVERDSVDLILLDLGASDRGFEPLTRLLGQAPGIPVVVLSDVEDDGLAAEAVRLGAQDLLVKGRINDNVIVRVVRDALQRSRVLTRMMELDGAKSEFLATVSHEMRTPLAIIREFVSLVHDGVAGEVVPEQRDCLDAALRNCDRLAGLINDLLDSSQIEAGKLKLRRAAIDPLPLLRQVHADFLRTCKIKHQRLSLDVPETLPRILADPDKIQQVIVNLLGNAHKFTRPGAEIALRAGVETDSICIEVRDDGPGISEKEQPRVFDAFTQIERKHAPGPQGTGLGLAISRNIVQLHGGVISLESAPGRGSRFFFTVPLYVDGSELEALVQDRRREYHKRKKAASLVTLRCVPRIPLAPDDDQRRLRALLDRIHTEFRRLGDEAVHVESRQLVACVMESPPAGCRIALNRLAEELESSGIDAGTIEFSLQALDDLESPVAFTSLESLLTTPA